MNKAERILLSLKFLYLKLAVESERQVQDELFAGIIPTHISVRVTVRAMQSLAFNISGGLERDLVVALVTEDGGNKLRLQISGSVNAIDIALGETLPERPDDHTLVSINEWIRENSQLLAGLWTDIQRGRTPHAISRVLM